MWAIRDCRTLSAQEKSLLWAVESRGIHYGTWETVAADAGMKRDAYYNWRRKLEAKGVLSVTERPGKTTVHEVNAGWFALNAVPANANDPSGNPAQTPPEDTNDPSGNPVMKEDYKGDHVSGPSKNHRKVKRIGGPIYLRLVRLEEMNAWGRVEHEERVGAMTEQECSEWRRTLDAESHLP